MRDFTRLCRMLGALLLASLSFTAAAGVVVNVALPDRASGAERDLWVDVTFTNAGNTPVSMPGWMLPSGELDGDLFLLTRDGVAVSYLGPVVKRAAPTAEDMITLAPGESLTRAVDLAGAYDLTRAGQYSIQYGVASMHLPASAERRTQFDAVQDESQFGEVNQGVLLSNEVVAAVAGGKSRAVEAMLARASEAAQTAANTSSIAYSGRCTTSEKSTIVSAVASASTMANGAVSYLNGTPRASTRYTTWFGTYSSTNWNTVKGHYVNIKDALDNKPLTIDCACNKSYYAYVYPDQPYKIYVCRAFWSAPLSGTDSKGGTLVHELSHFNIIAGTDDFAYGQTAAKQLAISNPAQARFNADSHEYFAENTPNLP